MRRFGVSRLEPLVVVSEGDALFGSALIAEGSGPHPAVLLLHGFPGYEQNADLAHQYRRAGWNVFVFHYRGTWGSHGAFSFTHMLSDVSAMLDFISSGASRARFATDITRIVLIGHSVGGFAALMTAVHDTRVSATAAVGCFNLGASPDGPNSRATATMISAAFDGTMAPLQGTSASELIREVSCHQKAWDLIGRSADLAPRPLLIIGGSRDEVAPLDVHHDPLVEALHNAGAMRLEHRVVNTDHVFSDKRLELARATSDWLSKWN